YALSAPCVLFVHHSYRNPLLHWSRYTFYGTYCLNILYSMHCLHRVCCLYITATAIHCCTGAGIRSTVHTVETFYTVYTVQTSYTVNGDEQFGNSSRKEVC